MLLRDATIATELSDVSAGAGNPVVVSATAFCRVGIRGLLICGYEQCVLAMVKYFLPRFLRVLPNHDFWVCFAGIC